MANVTNHNSFTVELSAEELIHLNDLLVLAEDCGQRFDDGEKRYTVNPKAKSFYRHLSDVLDPYDHTSDYTTSFDRVY